MASFGENRVLLRFYSIVAVQRQPTPACAVAVTLALDVGFERWRRVPGRAAGHVQPVSGQDDRARAIHATDGV